jgi:voltage-gated potassium channel Kch
MDPGTIGGDDFKWPYILVMLAVTVGGIFIVSALIGVIATAFDQKLTELRKGRSFVIESNHTLILGWSESVFTILGELAVANESEKNPSVVILADRDKVEMEDAIEAKAGDMGRTRVICRSGSPIDLNDLEIVNPRAARSIIVLSAAAQEPDAEVIKTLLAVTQNPKRRPEPYHIVAEIEEASNLEAARIVGGDETVLIDKGQTIARLLVQASRQSGVSVVYTELFDFGGDEIYFREDPALAGKTFAETLLAYEDCSVVGIRKDGVVKINPAQETRVAPGDEIVAVAADDETLVHAKPLVSPVDPAAIAPASPLVRRPTRVLLLGWNARSPAVIRELDEYLEAGSSLMVVAEAAAGAGQLIARQAAGLRHLGVEFHEGHTTDRATLNRLEVLDYDTVIVMCYSDLYDPQRADARTLVTLLHLRDISAKAGRKVSIVSEMLDDRNRELAQVTKVDDVIVSDKVISLIITQISENPALAAVFDDLLDTEGAEIYLRPVDAYVTGPTTFATVVQAASGRNETAIGYRTQGSAEDAAASFGVVVNPPKSTPVAAAPGDRVIVLADD